MKIYITVIMIGLLVGCSSQQKIPNLKDAASQGDLEDGFYNKKNGENVYIEVQSLRQKAELAEKKAFEAQRQADYNQRQMEAVQHENLLLRARGNYKIEQQVNEIQGFDNQHNPIVKQRTIEPEPQERPTRSRQNPGYVGDPNYSTRTHQLPIRTKYPDQFKLLEQREAHRKEVEAAAKEGFEPVQEIPEAPVAAAPSVPALPKTPQAAAPKAQAMPEVTPVEEPVAQVAEESTKPVVQKAADKVVKAARNPASTEVSDLPKPITE